MAKYFVLIHCIYGKWRNIFFFLHIFIYVFVSPILLLFILALFRKAAYRMPPQTNNLQPFQCNTFPLTGRLIFGVSRMKFGLYFLFLFYFLLLLLLPFIYFFHSCGAIFAGKKEKKNYLFGNCFSFLLLVHFCIYIYCCCCLVL